MLKEFVRKLRTKADMITMCEPIAFGSEAELMYQAAALIESLTTPKVSHCTACGKEIPYTEHIDNRQCLKHLQIYT